MAQSREDQEPLEPGAHAGRLFQRLGGRRGGRSGGGRFGTQTAGSIIRPAAIAGSSAISRHAAPTTGRGSRSFRAISTLSGRSPAPSPTSHFRLRARDQDAPSLDTGGASLRIGLMVPYRSEADGSARAFETIYKAAEAAGAVLTDIPSSLAFETVGDDHAAVMTGEAGQALSWSMSITQNA